MDERTYFYEQVIYDELRRIHSEASDADSERAYPDLNDAIAEGLNYSNLARMDGLLHLNPSPFIL